MAEILVHYYFFCYTYLQVYGSDLLLNMK